MTGDTLQPLAKLIGIDETRFSDVVVPFMNNMCSKCLPADQALLSIENSKVLKPVEKIFCAYATGRACMVNELDAQTGGMLKRTMKMLSR